MKPHLPGLGKCGCVKDSTGPGGELELPKYLFNLHETIPTGYGKNFRLMLPIHSEVDYCIGEKGAGSSSLLSCVMGLTEPLGGQTPFSRVSARIRARSSKLLYAQRWMKLLIPPYSEYQQPANDEYFTRSGIAAPHASKTCGMPSGG